MPENRPPTLAELILLRLLPAKTSISLTVIRKEIDPFFRHPPNGSVYAETVEELKAALDIQLGRGNRLTEQGRAKALAFLKVKSLPPRANFATIKAKHLVPMSQQIKADAVEKSEALQALLLKRKLNLPVATSLTLNAVYEAYGCQLLGYPEHTSVNRVIELVIGKALNQDKRLDKVKLSSALATANLAIRDQKLDTVRNAAIRSWIDPETKANPTDNAMSAKPLSLEEFAKIVLETARQCEGLTPSDDKIFISHVWNKLANHPQIGPFGLDGFKTKLVEASRKRLLTLIRADLMQFMDEQDVFMSKVTDQNATFHFILSPR